MYQKLCFSEDNKLGELLQVATGMERLPFLGFDKPASLLFKHETDETDATRFFPFYNTCAITVSLPCLHKQYDIFSFHMRCSLGIQNFTEV